VYLWVSCRKKTGEVDVTPMICNTKNSLSIALLADFGWSPLSLPTSNP
jgi:hypothetical protein